MRIVVSGMWDFRISSLGAQALCDGLLSKLNDVFPQAQLKTLPQAKLVKGISLVCRALERPSLAAAPVLDLLYSVYGRSLRRRVEAIREADLVLVNGDGIVADIFCPDTLVLAMDLRTAMHAGVKCASLNQSINIAAGTLAFHSVREFFVPNPLSVREPNSQKILQQLFPHKATTLAIDAAFLVEPLRPAESQLYSDMTNRLLSRYAIDKYVLCGVRATRPRSQPIDMDSWAELLQQVQAAFAGHALVLASTCPEHDIPLAAELQRRVPGSVLPMELADHARYNYRFFMQLLRGASCTVSDRYHQSVLAALMGTPFLAVEGNTSKTRGTVEMLDYPLSVQPLPVPSTLPACKNAVRALADGLSSLRDHLTGVVPERISAHDRYREFLLEM